MFTRRIPPVSPFGVFICVTERVRLLHSCRHHFPQLSRLPPREKSWTNGLCCPSLEGWVISWLRSHGVQSSIVFTVDNGEEFGGKSWMKIKELRKLISGFCCRLIQNHKGSFQRKDEENDHLERSHRIDDEEFYIPRALHINSEADPLNEAMGYIYYYNNIREHSSLSYQTPSSYLKTQLPDINDKIRFVVPIMLV